MRDLFGLTPFFVKVGTVSVFKQVYRFSMMGGAGQSLTL